MTTKLDNDLLFGGLDSYAGTPEKYEYPPAGILLKANFKDLLEDYQLEGGIRLPTTFNGAEYFLVFDDRKRRLDRRYAVYRRSQTNTLDEMSFTPAREETVSVIALGQVRYPLDIFTSIRATTTLRMDRITQLATNDVTLNQPTIREQRIGLKAEYVFDNTLDIGVNIKNGTRYKVYAEVVKRFNLQLYDGASLDFEDGFMTIIGLDGRHYQRVLKHSVLALRAAAATTLGSEKMLFYLGGVDNWLFPSFNQEIPVSVSGDIAYQTLTGPLRGFQVNIRNGSSFAVANAELRVPIFRYFSKRIRNSFFRNFQAVGFFDVGTAWEGSTPFSDENPLNTTFISDPRHPVSLKVNYFRDPIVAGYGLGVRSVLFGYFLRVDYAWGIETREVQDPRLYFSIGLDF